MIQVSGQLAADCSGPGRARRSAQSQAEAAVPRSARSLEVLWVPWAVRRLRRLLRRNLTTSSRHQYIIRLRHQYIISLSLAMGIETRQRARCRPILVVRI